MIQIAFITIHRTCPWNDNKWGCNVTKNKPINDEKINETNNREDQKKMEE